MLNLALTGFFAAMILLGFKRPFLWVLCYLYVDIVAPQIISWGFLTRLPISLIAFAAAFLGWLVFDDKRDSRFTWRQGLIGLLLLYCAMTTFTADYPEEALTKWSWVWKALVFAMFLPLTLRTRLRIEAGDQGVHGDIPLTLCSATRSLPPSPPGHTRESGTLG